MAERLHNTLIESNELENQKVRQLETKPAEDKKANY
jgi:hypothetical protein